LIFSFLDLFVFFLCKKRFPHREDDFVLSMGLALLSDKGGVGERFESCLRQLISLSGSGGGAYSH